MDNRQELSLANQYYWNDSITSQAIGYTLEETLYLMTSEYYYGFTEYERFRPIQYLEGKSEDGKDTT